MKLDPKLLDKGWDQKRETPSSEGTQIRNEIKYLCEVEARWFSL